MVFLGVAALLTVTPGADMALVTRNALGRGGNAALCTTFGIALGCLVHAVASSLGLSLILSRSAAAFQTLKQAGALYLVYIGWRSLYGAWRGTWQSASAAASEAAPARSFVEGLLTNLLNPKVALFYLTFLPQFVDAGRPVLTQAVLLAGVHIIMGLAWLTLYAALISRMSAVLARPSVRAKLEAATGAVLVGLGVRLAVERG